MISRTEGIVYKRVAKNTRTKNKLTLVSDNPVFQPYTISSEDVLEMWEAQVVISKTNTLQRWNVNQLANIVTDLQQQVSTLKKKVSN